MTTSEQQAVPVAQSDRDAAIEMLNHAFRNVGVKALKSVVPEDIYEHFARHRLASHPCKSGEGAGASAVCPSCEGSGIGNTAECWPCGGSGKVHALTPDAGQTREVEWKPIADAPIERFVLVTLADGSEEDVVEAMQYHQGGWKMFGCNGGRSINPIAWMDKPTPFRAALNARGDA